MKFQNIPIEKCFPKTKEGKTKMIGAFDYEGTYSHAKFLQAKRYMTEENGELSLTVSGLNKKVTIPYLKKTYGSNTNIFEVFTDNLYIPPEHTGKMTHTYIDNEQHGAFTDYLGQYYEYHELSSIHLENSYYTLNMTDGYIQFLKSFGREY